MGRELVAGIESPYVGFEAYLRNLLTVVITPCTPQTLAVLIGYSVLTLVGVALYLYCSLVDPAHAALREGGAYGVDDADETTQLARDFARTSSYSQQRAYLVCESVSLCRYRALADGIVACTQ